MKIKPHSCPLHDSGPIWELQLQELNRRIAGNPDSAEAAKWLSQVRKLKTKVARYERHLEQYSLCRDAINEKEDSLEYGDGRCVLYRDFVNVYNERGEKVKNLVLTKLTRAEDGSLLVVKLHNFCTDKQSGCDAFYTHDVMDFHLKSEENGGSGQFETINEIFMSGDHGPHFSCNETVYDQSCFFERHGKIIHDSFLCSYHAYNRCDGNYSVNPVLINPNITR